MNKCIIYTDDSAAVSVMIPVSCRMTIEQIAQKDVPVGRPYKIVDRADLPPIETIAAWTIDPAELTDGVGLGYAIGWPPAPEPEPEPEPETQAQGIDEVAE